MTLEPFSPSDPDALAAQAYVIEGLYRAAAAISAAENAPDICQSLASHLLALVHADRSLTYLVDPLRRDVLASAGAGSLLEDDLNQSYGQLQAGLAGVVLRTGQPLISLDPDDGLEPEATRTRRRQAGTGSVMIAPLTARGERLGVVLALNRTDQPPFTDQDQDLMMTLAALAAAAIASAQLHAAMQSANRALARRAVQLEASRQIGEQVTSSLDLDVLLSQVASAIQMHFGYYFVGVWLQGDQPESIGLQAAAGRAGADLAGRRLPADADHLAAEVCRTGQVGRVNDLGRSRETGVLAALVEARSVLVLPLRVGERTLGALETVSDQPEAFGADDQAVLQSLADQISIALRNAQLYQAEQHRRHLAEALELAGRELTGTLDLRQVPDRILEQLDKVVPYERGAISLRQGGEWSLVAQRGYPAPDAAETHLQQMRGLLESIVELRRSRLVEDVLRAPEVAPDADLPADRAWLGVPLLAEGRVSGVIMLTRPPAELFGLPDATLASAFAGQAAIALENARLYDETMRYSEMMERMVEARVQELNRALHILEQMDKTKSRFIEVTAHELRTPLTLVKGYGSMLASLPATKTPEAQPLVEGILTGVARLHEIINSMLDVAKIDSQSLTMRREPLRLLTLARRVEADYRAALAERQIRLVLDGIDALPTIEADSLLLHKALGHLVGNAIKYTPDGGQVTVRGQLTMDEVDGPAIQLTVADTGIGIDPEYHHLIFEKFYQMGEVALHSSGKTKFKGGGPGLGLAIVRGIIQAHGGRIWVESPGHDETRCPGSQFHIWLPLPT